MEFSPEKIQTSPRHVERAERKPIQEERYTFVYKIKNVPKTIYEKITFIGNCHAENREINDECSLVEFGEHVKEFMLNHYKVDNHVLKSPIRLKNEDILELTKKICDDTKCKKTKGGDQLDIVMYHNTTIYKIDIPEGINIEQFIIPLPLPVKKGGRRSFTEQEGGGGRKTAIRELEVFINTLTNSRDRYADDKDTVNKFNSVIGLVKAILDLIEDKDFDRTVYQKQMESLGNEVKKLNTHLKEKCRVELKELAINARKIKDTAKNIDKLTANSIIITFNLFVTDDDQIMLLDNEHGKCNPCEHRGLQRVKDNSPKQKEQVKADKGGRYQHKTPLSSASIRKPSRHHPSQLTMTEKFRGPFSEAKSSYRETSLTQSVRPPHRSTTHQSETPQERIRRRLYEL